MLKKTAGGFGSPELAGGRAANSRGFFSSVAWQPYGRAVWEGASPAGACYRSTNLHGSAHPVW